jgi:hypothetical protein
MSTSLRPILCALILAVGGATAAAQDQPIHKNVSSSTLEGILANLNIQHKKSPGDKQGVFLYDFERGGYKIRLHNYDGKDLWIEALWSDRLALEDVNRWNQKAKFSRCVLLNNNGKITTSLESQFDCLGGCTDAIIRQFIVRFDGEVRNFATFVNDTQTR